jgi:quercetin dioxygenase-like cupin family protein
VILKPGDAIYYEDDVVHTARGAGDQPAIVLGTLVLTTGQPLLMPAGMAMGATPTP